MKLRHTYIAGALLALTTFGMGVGILPPSQPAIAQQTATCDGVNAPLIIFETRSYFAYICEDQRGGRNSLYYLGIQKDDPAVFISAPVVEQTGGNYVARSGNTTYRVNNRTLEVTQNNRRIVSESVIRTIDPDDDADAPQESERVIRACRERGARELGTTVSDIQFVSSRADRSGVRTLELTSRRTGAEMTCRSTLEGRIVSFDINEDGDDDDNDDTFGEVRFQTLSYAVRVYEDSRGGERADIVSVLTNRRLVSNAAVRVNSRANETTYTTGAINGLSYTIRVKNDDETSVEISDDDRLLAVEFATIDTSAPGRPGSGSGISAVPRESLQACRDRAVFELDTTSRNLELYDATVNRQGTYTVFMRLRDDVRTEATCEVRGTNVSRFTVR